MTFAFLEKFERLGLFTEKEAWTLFKLAAFAEAIGWSLLGSAVMMGNHLLPNGGSVKIAGQIHGTFFMIYLAITCAVYASLGWSRKRTIVAVAASVPPFGSLVFEQWAAYKRRSHALKHRRELQVRAIILSGDLVLAIQPKDSTHWLLPGGEVLAHETAEEALARHVHAQTSIMPRLGKLMYIAQHHSKKTEQLELFFSVLNNEDFAHLKATGAAKPPNDLDEIQFIQAKGNRELHPEFLSNEPLAIHMAGTEQSTTLITI